MQQHMPDRTLACTDIISKLHLQCMRLVWTPFIYFKCKQRTFLQKTLWPVAITIDCHPMEFLNQQILAQTHLFQSFSLSPSRQPHSSCPFFPFPSSSFCCPSSFCSSSSSSSSPSITSLSSSSSLWERQPLEWGFSRVRLPPLSSKWSCQRIVYCIIDCSETAGITHCFDGGYIFTIFG